MKIEKKLITIEKNVYVADDGKEFASKSECEQHEKDLLEKKNAIVVNELPQFYCYPDEIDSEYDINFYYVRNEAELDAVKQYSFSDPDAIGWGYEVTAFPCWIRVVVEGDYGCGCICSFEDEFASAQRYIMELKNKKAKAEALFHLYDGGKT